MIPLFSFIILQPHLGTVLQADLGLLVVTEGRLETAEMVDSWTAEMTVGMRGCLLLRHCVLRRWMANTLITTQVNYEVLSQYVHEGHNSFIIEQAVAAFEEPITTYLIIGLL